MAARCTRTAPPGWWTWVVCPGTRRPLSMGTDQTPSRAAAPSFIKTAKSSGQSNFVPFVVETGGRINATGLEFFDGALEGDSRRC